jgi:D-hydroxyproline dehydrogenase subunit gamma
MTAERNVTDNTRPVPGGAPARATPDGAPAGTGLTITADGETLNGVRGQSIAGVLLAAGHVSWRTTAAGRRPRGIFCGIGVCYDCLATVNGVRDVRVCQRLASDGDVVTTQAERLPGDDR